MALAVRPEVNSADAAAFLNDAHACYRSVRAQARPPLRFGVDLGTATIVLTAVDAAGRPVYWDAVACAAVRDGVVVDFAGAADEVRALKERAQVLLGMPLAAAATAFPPRVAAAEARACRYVLERSGLGCRALVDEVSAAQALLGIEDGVIVDVGGGSTGVGVFRHGELVRLSDAPGGGHHLDLIIAGAMKIPVEEAQTLKHTSPDRIADIVVAGIERIAESIRVQVGGERLTSVHLVGGALLLSGAPAIIARYLSVEAISYPYADLITPFGMALCDG